MRNIKMTMSRMQLNSKFVNNMLLEWGRFVTAVKLNKGLRDSNYDQLYAYLKQHEAHANVNKMLLDRFTQHTVDPLALMSNVVPQQYNSQSSTNPSSTYVPPYFADNSQLDSELSPTDNLIENLTNTLALLTQSYKTYLPQTNNQLRTSSNPRNQATVQDGRVVVQNVQGHIARNCTQPKRPQNSKYFKDKMLLMQAQENGVALDEEQLLFLASRQDNAVDEDVDEQPVQDLALNVDNVFQADDYDAFDSDVDEAPTAQTMFMANLSSADPVYDGAILSYDSDILFEVYDHDLYQDAICEHHEEHEMHDDYVKDNAVPVVQINVYSVPNDAYMMIYNDMYEPHAQSVSKTTRNTVVDNSLTAELATYKEQVELYERQARFELTEREQKIDEQLRIVITDRNIKEENLKKELHSIKFQLAFTINHNKLMVEEIMSLKKDFKQKENKYLEEFLDMKALKEKVEDKLYKQDQSLQTVHMLCKPKPYYDELNKLNVSSFTEMHDAHTGLKARCLELEVEFSNLHDKIQEDNHTELVKWFSNLEVVQIVLWYLDSDCSKHMTGDRSWLRNFMEKFTGTVRFGNDHFGDIMGYGDYVIGESVISRVYYVEGLGHNLFSVGQFYDSNLEVAFRKHSCYVRDTDVVELIKGSHGSNLYTILIEDMMKSSPICLLSKASKNKSWLWHRRLNHLNLDNGTEFVNKDLTEYYERVGIFHQKYKYRGLHMQNGRCSKKRNSTLLRLLRTMLIFSKAQMFLWAEAVATAFFGALCYPTNDSGDLGKLQPTADIGIFVAYAPSRKGSGPKDLVFIKSSAHNSEMSITGSNKPKLYGVKVFTLSNHDTGK
ncbi:retrovirus-related pol polyprotein from transposon TNT 1-94, partial [Tanacetum coccineum]